MRYVLAGLIALALCASAHAINIIGLPQQPVTATVVTPNTAGLATFNGDAGTVITGSTNIATGATYTLTINNNQVHPSSIVSVDLYNGSNTTGVPFVSSIVKNEGQLVITITNAAATGVAALGGTLKVDFIILN